MDILLTQIATVKNTRTAPGDDFWGGTVSEIELREEIPTEAFDGMGDFSHLEIIYYFNRTGDGFNRTGDDKIVYARRPRGNPKYPRMGIFAQRNKDRPNSIGLATVELLEHTGRVIKVRYLDALDGTPVLDIKPVFREFMPKTAIRQPEWVGDLMKDYWRIDET
jgi:tRNA-Thr(GGU) m(6)t(6)A37 methyltransferase TsaA